MSIIISDIAKNLSKSYVNTHKTINKHIRSLNVQTMIEYITAANLNKLGLDKVTMSYLVEFDGTLHEFIKHIDSQFYRSNTK